MILHLRRPALFIGIDPGVAKSYAVSLFYDAGTYSSETLIPMEVRASVFKLRHFKDAAPWACAALLQQTADVDTEYGLTSRVVSHLNMGHTVAACVEGQDVSYTTKTSKAKPQSICDLSLITGSFLGVLGLYMAAGKTLFCPTPHAWKGNAPKKINQARTLTKLGLDYHKKGGQKPYCVPDNWKEISEKGVTESNWYDLSDAAGLALHAVKQFVKAGA